MIEQMRTLSFGLEHLGIKILKETVKNCALFERQPDLAE
jgi:hypothetical protein